MTGDQWYELLTGVAVLIFFAFIAWLLNRD